MIGAAVHALGDQRTQMLLLGHETVPIEPLVGPGVALYRREGLGPAMTRQRRGRAGQPGGTSIRCGMPPDGWHGWGWSRRVSAG